ncbi:hypothetical protein PPERSA_02662 [Pseudocohnilembus persalinus]|uniref:Transmembrane protein n=1 Tax=Pseudocohnilembus persalinus TaxID=266149 RepID=A0A0V0R5N7_PSEPJ|nr:hypothetical protein PPERSA_02662 [Pseudocohnilembus persalinus]|eukprot:KRX09790.1 hypothetical protein PPERSA_02662 [Pseudocohnilembus persalinus]
MEIKQLKNKFKHLNTLKIILVLLFITNIYADKINPKNKAVMIKEQVSAYQFEVDINFGETILEFAQQQGVFNIQMTPKTNDPKYEDPVGFCQAYPNMALFQETPGTYTQMYPHYFDENGNLLDSEKIPPTLTAYHRTIDNDIVAIDSDYNFYEIEVQQPTDDKPYHQPHKKSTKSFAHLRPAPYNDETPFLTSILDKNNDIKTTLIIFGDNVYSYNHKKEIFEDQKGWVPVNQIHRAKYGYAVGIGVRVQNQNPLLFIAAGEDGGFIYEVRSDNSLNLLQFIDGKFIERKKNKVDFRDVDHVSKEGFVYFLDKRSGVHKIDINYNGKSTPTVSHDSNFHLSFSGGLRSRHHSTYNSHKVLKHQVFINILGNEQHKFIEEYLFNYELGEYFMNSRKHYPDIEPTDVIVTYNFAILLGQNMHKIVYHSVLEQFQTDQMEYVNDLSLTYIPGLIDSQIIEDNKHQDVENYQNNEFNDPKYFLIGISKRNIVFHDVTIVRPSIDCWPVYYQYSENGEKVLNTQQYNYEVTFLSRNCQKKDEQNLKYADYAVCEVVFDIQVVLYDSWLDVEYLNYILIAVFILSIVVLGCFCWGYCKYRRARTDQMETKQKIKEFLKKVKGKKGEKKDKKDKNQNIKYAQMQEEN